MEIVPVCRVGFFLVLSFKLTYHACMWHPTYPCMQDLSTLFRSHPTVSWFDLKISPSHSYSQTRCSFARNFANFRCNVGILIGSLLWAICNWHEQLAPGSCKFPHVDSSASSSSYWTFCLEYCSVDYLVHANDSWGQSAWRKCLNNVCIAAFRSRRIKHNATIKFLFTTHHFNYLLKSFTCTLYDDEMNC